MKKVLFYLNIAFAIFFLNSLYATGAFPELGFKTAQQGYAFDSYPLSSENIFFDACLEDVFEDDLSESEKKKCTFGQISHHYTSFIAQKNSKNDFKIFLPADHFFPRKAPLLTFLCVFRI
jgi:hypothetical protein